MMAKKPQGKKKPERFVFFAGASFDKILSEMQTVAQDPNRRVEFHPGKKPSAAQVFVEPLVRSLDGGGGGTNDAHVCPGDPLCPKP